MSCAGAYFDVLEECLAERFGPADPTEKDVKRDELRALVSFAHLARVCAATQESKW